MKKEMILALAFLVFVSPFVYADSCKDVHIGNWDSSKALDITFITDGYSNNDMAVEKQLNSLILMMGEMSPFNEFIDNKINIRYVKTDEVNDLECCSKTNLFSDCDHIKVKEEASTCWMTDEVVIFSAQGDLGDSCSEEGIDTTEDGLFCQ